MAPAASFGCKQEVPHACIRRPLASPPSARDAPSSSASACLLRVTSVAVETQLLNTHSTLLAAQVNEALGGGGALCSSSRRGPSPQRAGDRSATTSRSSRGMRLERAQGAGAGLCAIECPPGLWRGAWARDRPALALIRGHATACKRASRAAKKKTLARRRKGSERQSEMPPGRPQRGKLPENCSGSHRSRFVPYARHRTSYFASRARARTYVVRVSVRHVRRAPFRTTLFSGTAMHDAAG
jgi:hypothetical protein